MPTCNDYAATMLTVRTLLEHQVEEGVEILIVDNSPDEKYRKALKKQINAINSKFVRYMEFTQKKGPAETKNQVFENASGEYVMCMDSHVILNAGSISKLLDFLNNLPEDQKDDFFTGPLKHNDGNYSTHFQDVWRGEMWGTWGTDNSLLETDEPKEIWAQGCGLMLCKKSSWLGFNKNFTGFGGEEGYIHEKYRQNNRKVWLLPWLGWWHKFGDPDTKHYLLTRYAKVRNYVLEHQELGRDVQEIYDHFVGFGFKQKNLVEHLIEEHSMKREEIENLSEQMLQEMHGKFKIKEDQWKRIIANPEHNEFPERILPEFTKAKSIESNDLKDHFDNLYMYAKKCKYVSEISRRSLSTLPLIAAKAKNINSIMYEVPHLPLIEKQKEVTQNVVDDFSEGISKLEDTELCFIKFPHEYDKADESLVEISSKVSKYLAIHDTLSLIHI